ncbi:MULTISPECIES: acyltransferase family protein [unclassified Cryobacterium]|uniref:acyltransferase family protein n=1 Tax=unclassified Cryobacterium TaxID=2649013 RepID=UPI001F54198C|nr:MULTISPECIES: acyltransferase family protein [unclassified Cryobacterium]
MTSTLKTERPAPAPPRETTVRRDIQGLRAVAIVAVVLNHVIMWPTGGFIGVDIFFVISGFLITGILLRDHETTGTISLRRFYARRIRRIAPAAVTVLVATAVLAHFLFNTTRALSTLWDAAWAFVFAANWHFTAIGTDYFHATDPASPLQPYWSLSVEEQFYLVWPIVVLLVLTVGAKRLRSARRGRVVLGLVMVVVIVVSFCHALGESATTPSAAYLSTFSRVWELGVGALLAAAAPVFHRIPVALRGLLGWAGLLGILAGFFLIDDTLAFPGPWAAVPVAATALVIIGGITGPQHYLFPLTNPLSVWIGDLSYSLYLWHFPVMVFLLMADPTLSVQVILGMILALSIVSYYLIEQPLHRSPWLHRFGDSAESRRLAWRTWREKFGSQFILAGLSLFVIATVIGVSAQVTLHGTSSPAAPIAAPGPVEDPTAQLQADLGAAASSTEWPGNLSPTLDDAIATTSKNNPARGCFDVGSTPSFDGCTWGSSDAPNHMYLVGDSTALAYAPAFKAIAEGSNGQWKITTIGLYGCRFTAVPVQNDGAGVMDACPQRKQDVAQRIVADNPRLVVISNAYALGKTPDRTALSAETLVASTAAEAAVYNAAGRIVYLAPPPLGASLGQCYSPVSSPQNCNTGIDQAWQDFAAATSALNGSGSFFVSSLPFSCYNGACPAFAGTIPTKYDTVHMTPAYSTHIAPAIRFALGALGLM